jgi:DNA repair exonuclease SbcCD ATPase subunit
MEKSSKTLKEYGLEFINEIAKERTSAQQEIGVVISGAKSSLVSQGVQHFTYHDIDDFVKIVRKQTLQIVDSELTKITIKSLGRIRGIIHGEDKFLQIVDSTISEEEKQQLEEEITKFKMQIKEKNDQISELEQERDNTKSIFEKNQDELNENKMEVKRLQNQLDNFHEQEKINQKRLDEVIYELGRKEALIDKLKENEKIHEKDIQEALASIAETYQIQEDYFARQLEESIQQRLKQVRQEYDLELEEMQSRLKNEIQRYEEADNQHKKTVTRLEESLVMAEEEQRELHERLTEIVSETSQRNLILEYVQRLLSNHPLYASILILLNLGGSLDISTMAMSVGAHPLKLKQMLDDLVSKGLITISLDDPPIVSAVMD